ncbi:MAG: hypothetical protein AAGG72_05365 [Pseudomonadota bacterium]
MMVCDGNLMPIDDATAGKVREAFESGVQSVPAIARTFNVTAAAIRYRAKRDGWRRTPGMAGAAAKQPTRTNDDVEPGSAPVAKVTGATGKAQTGKRPTGQVKKKPSRPVKTAKAKSKSTRGRASRRGLVKRIYRAIDTKLRLLEARLDQREEQSPSDSEREMRELSSMIRGFEKVTAVADDMEQSQSRRAKQGAPERDQSSAGTDAERMREEIAERIERLITQGALETGAGEADSEGCSSSSE